MSTPAPKAISDPTSLQTASEAQGQARPERGRPTSQRQPVPKPTYYHPHSHVHSHQSGTDYAIPPWKYYDRPQSPSLKWHKDITQLDPNCGRVLVVDFIKWDHTKGKKRKVVAQEINDLDDLRRLYRDTRRENSRILRLYHVQNAPWATKFLLRKFNIDSRDDLVGTDFGRYASEARPRRRTRQPVMSGKTWRVQHDPWRGISKTSFGFDYLKKYNVDGDATAGADTSGDKLMELNCLDEDESPHYGFDVKVQRFACYVQHKESYSPPPAYGPNGLASPYEKEDPMAKGSSAPRRLPQLASLDNDNAIILFDSSHSSQFLDTLIPCRSEWETHWRRLPFYLAYDSPYSSTNWTSGSDELLGLQCAKIIIDDVFKALMATWSDLLDTCQTHVSILEDKVYAHPSDETRAPELWTNSSWWLKLEKLSFVHSDVVKELQNRLRELNADTLANSDSATIREDEWLEEIPAECAKVSTTIDEDLTKPTQALLSLLYQSVSIRDSRHGLALNDSMWRLSWITFIFLPLTFIVGFFGMNVDTFQNNPSIKWYFIAAVPMMVVILGVYYLLKSINQAQGRTVSMRGVYEAFFHEMSDEAPTLWTRGGPRDYIATSGFWQGIKWRLVQRWSSPDRTIRAATYDSNPEDDLGQWSRIKRLLVRRWTRQIYESRNTARPPTDTEAGMLSDFEEGHVVADALIGATEMLTVPGQPIASHAIDQETDGRHHFVRPLAPRKSTEGQEAKENDKLEPQMMTLATPQSRIANGQLVSSTTQTAAVYATDDLSEAVQVIPHSIDATIDNLQPLNLSLAERNSRSSSGENSRDSGLLVEEEDPVWLSRLGEQGRGWWFRRGSGGSGGLEVVGQRELRASLDIERERQRQARSTSPAMRSGNTRDASPSPRVAAANRASLNERRRSAPAHAPEGSRPRSPLGTSGDGREQQATISNVGGHLEESESDVEESAVLF